MFRIYVGLFFISLATLMMELALIRAFDVILVPNMAYMVITCGLFSFGLSGVYRTLKPLPKNRDTHSYLALISVLFGITALMILPIT